MKQLETARVVSCTEAAWQFLGLSLAGWNVVISLALAGMAISPLPGKSSVKNSQASDGV
jgi:disulfide bond formation protein DsbB